MSSCIAADASLSSAKPAWRAVYALALGVFGLIVAEFLPASLLTPMASSLGVSEGMAGQAVTATALVALVTGLLIATATRNIDRSLSLIKDAGCRAGLVLNPATPVYVLEHVLDKLDVVLLMSVNPGFGGQSFIEQTLVKISQVRSLLDMYYGESGQRILLEVDGGIKADNIAAVAAAGADTFVAGSAIFGHADYAAQIAAMRAALAGVAHP